MEKAWFVYVLECIADDSLYTGITNDLKKRIRAHNDGTGAKYTRGRGPFNIKYVWFKSSKSDAAKQEYEFKKNTRKKKLEIIDHLLGTERNGEDTEHTRWHPLEIIGSLKKEGWKTDWEVDDSNPDNNSTYIIWNKDDKQLYLGNYFMEMDGRAFPWKDFNVEESTILAFLNGDIEKAFK